MSDTVNVLLIEGGNGPDGWTWNQWYRVGEISRETLANLDTNRKLLRWMRSEGYLSEGSAGRVAVDDDQYNLVIVDKNTRKPLFAIEYGAKQ